MAIIDELFKDDPEGQRFLAQEEFIVDTMEFIYKAMKNQNISRSDMAKALKVSKARITRIFNGSSNVTLRTLSDMFHVIGIKPEIREKKEANTMIYLVDEPYSTEWAESGEFVNEACNDRVDEVTDVVA